MATVSDLQNIRFSGNPQADSLLENPAPWNFFPDGRKVLYYTFDVRAGSVADQDSNTALTAFNIGQVQSARQIMAYAGQVTGITFTEVSSSAQADIHFAATNLQGPTTAGLASSFYNYGYSGSEQTLTSLNAEVVIYLDNVEHARINNTPNAGTVGYEVLLHEVGHALGLAHPFDSPRPLPASQDNTNNTVMSYTDAGSPKTTFQAYDLLALDWIYGRDGLGGTYGFNSANGPTLTFSTTPTTPTAPTTPTTPTTPTGTAGADIFVSTNANESFNGLGGLDTLIARGNRGDYALQPTSAGGWTLGDGVPNRDGLDTLLQIERIKFADGYVALDLDGAAGTAARMLGALVGPAALNNRSLVGTVLKAVDAGSTPLQVAQLGLNALLGASATPEQVVGLLYANLTGVAADAGTVQALAGVIKSGAYTNASFAVAAANLDLNAAHINLVGLSSQGLEYL